MPLIKRNLKTLFTLAVPVVLAGLGAYWLLDLGGRRETAVTYETQPVSRGAIRRIVSTSGPVRALVTVSVGSQLSGQIARLNADFNTEVKEGDVLAVLDDKTFVAKVNQAKADLTAAEATLANQEAALQKAEAVLRQAERVAARVTTLSGKGFSSAAALDTATRDLEAARADVAVARAQIENGKATILQKRAVLEQAMIDLDRTKIRSPIDGTVISRTMDIGQTVAASLQAPEIFKIAQDLRSIRIEAQANEADIGQISEGNPVTFTVDAYPERRFEGQVVQVRLAAIELNSVVTYTVMIEAKNQDRRLFPGMTATVQIETDSRDGVLRVANEALRFKPKNRAMPSADVQGGKGGQGGGRNPDALIGQLRDSLQLTAQQVETVRAELADMRRRAQAERGTKGGPSGAKAPGGFGVAQPASADAADTPDVRARFMGRLEEVLRPILSDAQKPLFARWRSGRENTRPAVVWVLNAQGEIEGRSIRAGIADEQSTEIVGGRLEDGERVVVRAREVKK